MVLKLRLARVSTPGGAKRHKPFYNIVLAQARSARDSKPMEVLGTYDPIPKLPVGAEPGQRKVKDIKVDVARAKYWLGVGAQPSDTVWRLLAMIGLLEPKYLPHGPQTMKQARFPTHVNNKDRQDKGAVREEIEKIRRAGRVETDEAGALETDRAVALETDEVVALETDGAVANITSLQDPDAALGNVEAERKLTN